MATKNPKALGEDSKPCWAKLARPPRPVWENGRASPANGLPGRWQAEFSRASTWTRRTHELARSIKAQGVIQPFWCVG
jgi:hypothetical protein